jgi:hypothetical protein
MARGWESKSIEQQIEDARTDIKTSESSATESEQIEKQKYEGLRLQRARIVQELKSARNPRYREILNKMLQHIEESLKRKVKN